ncbi:UNVERIFIED_CONTAM: TetR/AcrR family transcriptional repressor of cmeABC operon [Brevibacillus sp. OAP136]
MTLAQIKAVSLPLFAKHGYEGASLSDIAQGVGIKKPSIYAHFKGKEDLFLAVFEDVLHHQVVEMEQLLEGMDRADTEKVLYAYLRANCLYFKQEDVKAAFLKRAMLFPPAALADELRARFLKQEEQLLASLTGIFTEGLQKGHLRPNKLNDLIAAYLAMMDGLFIQLYYYTDENHDERIAGAWNIFWSGVKR